jgi:hypothetical protein
VFAILYDDDHCVTYYAFITHKAVWHKMTTYIRYLIEAKRLSLLDAKRLYIYMFGKRLADLAGDSLD